MDPGRHQLCYKYCFVPCCRSTSKSTPDKFFFTIPRNEPLRSAWIKATRRDTKKCPMSPNSSFYCCEDHFNIEKDVENLTQYRVYQDMGVRSRLALKKGVVPSKFDCQAESLVTTPREPMSASYKTVKRQVVEKLISTNPLPRYESQSVQVNIAKQFACKGVNTLHGEPKDSFTQTDWPVKSAVFDLPSSCKIGSSGSTCDSDSCTEELE